MPVDKSGFDIRNEGGMKNQMNCEAPKNSNNSSLSNSSILPKYTHIRYGGS